MRGMPYLTVMYDKAVPVVAAAELSSHVSLGNGPMVEMFLPFVALGQHGG